MATRSGSDVTVGDVRDDDEAIEEIAEITGLSKRAVKNRLRDADGRTLVINCFAYEWPVKDDEEDQDEDDGEASVGGGNFNLITVTWCLIRNERNQSLYRERALYAYFDEEGPIYIGKAKNGAITRLTARDKGPLHDALYEYDIRPRIYVGHLDLHQNRRWSDKLLHDVESLLIKRLQPIANSKAKLYRISRPGLLVRMIGDWPHHRTEFRDLG